MLCVSLCGVGVDDVVVVVVDVLVVVGDVGVHPWCCVLYVV